MRLSVAALALSLVILHAAPAGAQFSLGSDTEWLAWAAGNSWAKVFGGNVRAGSGTSSGDWEYAIVNSGDIPQGGSMQYPWASMPAAHQYSFSYVGNSASLRVAGGVTTTWGTVPAPVGGINTIVARARAHAGTISLFDDFGIDLLCGSASTVCGTIAVATLAGDPNAEYRVIQDTRLAGGFRITDTATLSGRWAGSDPMYQFKVGTTEFVENTVVTPEPATLTLLASGLGALLLLRRRRTSPTL